MKPNRPLIVILSTVALDAVGIGLIMPVLPGLLRDLVHSNDVTAHYGILLALYALMQFACAPVLGALSIVSARRLARLAGLLLLSTTPSWRRRLSFGFSILGGSWLGIGATGVVV
ncbi:hypothetical protein [Escherichia coli]|uniref:hypothetical protein n=1 Tax=Escherichia coli TaxID=562 RepID=UPI002227685E|nr:hypothetical protein [Escherichia coli]MCW3362254.1 hypothetical protein [Escherichia coli]